MMLFVAYQYRRLLTGWPSPSAEDVLERFLDSIDGLEAPFFGWTHLMDLHLPIDPKIVDKEIATGVSRFEHFVAEGAMSGDMRSRAMDDVYDGALAYVDEQLGHFLEALDRRDLLENTVVIVTGDHGEALYDRGICGHPAHYLYDELLRVPLLVRIPSMGSERLAEPFSLAWLHELFADIIDVDIGEFPASSGRECLLDDHDDGVVVSDVIGPSGHSVAVRDSEYKYVTHYGGEPEGKKNKVLKDTTFRVQSDRGERVALKGSEAPAHLRDRAERIRTAPENLRSVEHEITGGVRKQLDELGYKM
jgi:choline-sulfatase